MNITKTNITTQTKIEINITKTNNNQNKDFGIFHKKSTTQSLDIIIQ